MSVVCESHLRSCRTPEGECGFCNVRTCRSGRIVSTACGEISSMALDPIEKKPFRRFRPGSQVVSIGSMGCSMRCPLCRNCEILMQEGATLCVQLQLQKLVDAALQRKQRGNTGITYTYNEPLINFEFILTYCKLARQHGLKDVITTNGYIQEQRLLELPPYVDATNIDMKAFDEEGYRRLQGDSTVVCHSVGLAAQHTHVEITSLMVPGLHDDVDRIEKEAAWFASLCPGTPLHLTRFFPMYHMYGEQSTAKQLVLRVTKAASGWLRYVYAGDT